MKAAIDRFLFQVKSIEKTIELGDRLVKFGQISPRHLDPAASSLRRWVREIGLSGMQPSLDGSVLLISAAIEQFVSGVMIAFATNLPDIVPAYRDLPNAIRSANERLTGEALTRTNSRFNEYDLQRFIDNLANCHSGTIPYVLNGEAIALNNRNLNAGRLRELMERLGVQDIWTVMASAPSLRNWSGPGGTKTTEPRAKNLLNELIDSRNQISHRVGRMAPGPPVIRSYIRFVRALARSLVKGIEDHSKSLAT